MVSCSRLSDELHFSRRHSDFPPQRRTPGGIPAIPHRAARAPERPAMTRSDGGAEGQERRGAVAFALGQRAPPDGTCGRYGGAAMEAEPNRITVRRSADALIVSEARFLRESLAEILTRAASIRVCRLSGTLAHALATAQAQRPEIVLLDVAFPGGIQAAARLSAAVPEASVVALAIVETEENVL